MGGGPWVGLDGGGLGGGGSWSAERDAAGAQGGDDAAVDEQVGAGQEPGLEHELGSGGDLVGGADPAGGAAGDHGLVAGGAGSGHLVLGQRGEDDAGADGVDARPAVAPGHGGALHPQGGGALGQGVWVDGGRDGG